MNTELNWTITSSTKEKPVKGRLDPEKVFTHYLRYQGKKVHSLTGDNGLTILTETASRYNLEGYVPDISSTRLLHELSQSQRKKLDDLWAKSVPDLFLVEVVKEEIPVQFQTCKHGTAFRYACPECDDESSPVESEVKV
jgi:hypothetical protein